MSGAADLAERIAEILRQRATNDQWLSSERLIARGEVFGPGVRPGLISSGLRGATGLGVGRVTVAPFSSPIRGTQLGDGCGP